MGEIFHLVYLSEAADDLSYTDIKEILESSRHNNSRAEITGLLIYRDGYFMQLLEGHEESVKEILNRIILDDRNYNLKILIEGKTPDRLFAGWAMAFHDGDITSNHNPYIEKLFQSPKHLKITDIMPLLRAFRDFAPEFN